MEVITYRPNRVIGLVVGGVGLALLLGLDVVFLLLLPQPPLGLLNFVWGLLFLLSFAPIGLLAFRTYSLWGAAYRLAEDRLIIEWGARREVIPLSDIREAVPGRDIERDLNPRGIWWPGCIVGRANDDRLGRVEFFASLPQDSQVFVVLSEGAFALSPEALEEFTAALNEGIEVRVAEPAASEPWPDDGSETEAVDAEPWFPFAEPGEAAAASVAAPEANLEAVDPFAAAETYSGEAGEAAEEPPAEAEPPARRESVQPAFEEWAVWQDRWALGLLIFGLVAVLALFAFVLLQIPSLPVTIPLQFASDGSGTPVRMGAPRGLLLLPLIGLLTLFLNGALGGVLHVRAGQRVAAYMLWVCAALVQVLVWVAALGLIAQA